MDGVKSLPPAWQTSHGHKLRPACMFYIIYRQMRLDLRARRGLKYLFPPNFRTCPNTASQIPAGTVRGAIFHSPAAALLSHWELWRALCWNCTYTSEVCFWVIHLWLLLIRQKTQFSSSLFKRYCSLVNSMTCCSKYWLNVVYTVLFMRVWQPVMKGLGQPRDTAQETDKTTLWGGFYPLLGVIMRAVIYTWLYILQFVNYNFHKYFFQSTPQVIKCVWLTLRLTTFLNLLSVSSTCWPVSLEKLSR